MASNFLDRFVTNVQALSVNPADASQLAQCVRKAISELSKHQASLENILPALENNSCAVVAVLLAMLQNDNSDSVQLFHRIKDFIANCNDKQIRVVPDIFCDLCHCLTDALVVKRIEPMSGVTLLATAIQKLRSAPSELTPIHSDLCQLCLVTKNLKPALVFLDCDITEILKEVISTPCSALSQIVIESYKKFVLVGLITHGKMPAVPKYTSNLIGRCIKHFTQVYEDFAKVFSHNKIEAVTEFVTKNQDQFKRDKNVGLVKQAVQSLSRRNIQRLTRTFLTLSLNDVAHRCHLSGADEAERYILNMIEDGDIFASINQKDGMVCFEDSSEKFVDTEAIENQIRFAMEQSELLDTIDNQMLLHPQYVQKSNKVTGHDDEGLSLTLPSSSSHDFTMQIDPI